jgi:hypothetical protein
MVYIAQQEIGLSLYTSIPKKENLIPVDISVNCYFSDIKKAARGRLFWSKDGHGFI